MTGCCAPRWPSPGVSAGLALRSARAQVRRCLLVPVAAGSALTGAGVPDLLAALPRLLPWARESACALSGVVYKIEHAERGRLAHCRIFGGELRVRDRAAAGEGRPGVITSLERSTPQGWTQTGAADRRRRRPGPGPRLGHRRRVGRRGHPRPGHPPVPAARARVRGRSGRPRPARPPVRRPAGAGGSGPADQPAARRRAARDRGQPLRRGAEGGDRRAAGRAVRRRRHLPPHGDRAPRADRGDRCGVRHLVRAHHALPGHAGVPGRARRRRLRAHLRPGGRARLDAARLLRRDLGRRSDRPWPRACPAGRSPTRGWC